MSRKLHAILFVLVLLLMGAPAQAQQETHAESPSWSSRVVVVSIADRRLALVENGAVKKVYRVAVGKPSTPSPAGIFAVISRVSDPTYYHEGKVVVPGRGNPVGSRWIGLSLKGYGIHGTNAPNSIGKAASHGCIRMGRRDLEELFDQVKAGDRVEIVDQRNAETIALFGEGIPGSSANGNTLVAQQGSVATPAQTNVPATARGE